MPKKVQNAKFETFLIKFVIALLNIYNDIILPETITKMFWVFLFPLFGPLRTNGHE